MSQQWKIVSVEIIFELRISINSGEPSKILHIVESVVITDQLNAISGNPLRLLVCAHDECRVQLYNIKSKYNCNFYRNVPAKNYDYMYIYM